MTCKDSHFLIGLGIGSIFGALAYGFAAKEKALYAGEKVADRVANETSVIAEKANDIKGKVHSMADEAKK